jgi:hypothetical protein
MLQASCAMPTKVVFGVQEAAWTPCSLRTVLREQRCANKVVEISTVGLWLLLGSADLLQGFALPQWCRAIPVMSALAPSREEVS